MATIAVITPTIGRKSLYECIERAQSLLQPGDCQFVVFDGQHIRDSDGVVPQVSREDLPVLPTLRCAEVSSLRSVAGNAQRDFAISLAVQLGTFDYLVFNDDDDLLCAEGVSVIHALPERERDVLRLFAVKNGKSLISPKADCKIDMRGSICGSNIVPPCVPSLPRWQDVNIYEGDPFFFGRCKQMFPKIEAHSEPIIDAVGWKMVDATKWRLA